jgi:hypothetical protein
MINLITKAVAIIGVVLVLMVFGAHELIKICFSIKPSKV